jgi:hypothetical protein
MMLMRIESWFGKASPWRSSRLIPAAVGFIFFSAAVLKALDWQSANPFPLAGNWFPVVLIELELLLAIWFWSGICATTSRFLSLMLFCVFVVFNSIQASEGAISCTCFGRIHLSPLFALVLDLVCVSLLAAWRPISGASLTAPKLSKVRLSFLASCLPLLIIPPVWAVIKSGANGLLLVASPNRTNLGAIQAGQHVESLFQLSNRGRTAVKIERIDTSCHCVHVELPRNVVEGDETMTGRITFELDDQSRFSGKLAVAIHGYTGTGSSAFALVVDARVGPPREEDSFIEANVGP